MVEPIALSPSTPVKAAVGVPKHVRREGHPRRACRLSRDESGHPRSLSPYLSPAYPGGQADSPAGALQPGSSPVQPGSNPAPASPVAPAALAALAPPSQQLTLALAAAARATLDPSELQESRGSKREALARTPPSAPPPERPPPAESRKKTRGTGALQAALAAAAPAAAAPQPPTATSPLAPALLADANPFRLLA